jgi:D-glycero-alpha-D-manno-heptose-7-phosphate kinase
MAIGKGGRERSMLITQTPLRVSLAGGGTDLSAYYDRQPGAVLSSAIDKYIYVILNQRFDDKIYVSYSRKEIVDSVDEIQHELVREAMRMAGVERGVEIAIMADIPSAGSGLGSSSSLTVGLLNALHTYRGVQVTAEQLAREACAIEIDRCGKPIGRQDQYIAAYGGLRFFEFFPGEEVRVTALPLGREKQEMGARLMLFFTGITRKADVILKEQKARSDDRREFLDGIRQLAFETRDAITIGEFDRIGDILCRNWELKKELASGVSTPAIDEMVVLAREGGATGCKVCGAGGGGFLLTCSARNDKERLRKTMSRYREMPFFLERFGSKVIFNVEGYEWK